jgi:hypothetical protein
MRNVLLLLLALCPVVSLNESTFQKLFSLIEVDDMDITQTFLDNQKNTPKFTCVANPFKRRLLKDSEVAFDGGFDGCGWEIFSLNLFCKNKSIQNLWAELRRVPNPVITKTTTLITTDPTDKALNVPVGRYIQSILTGYIFEGDSQYVSQLMVTLNSGDQINLQCATAEVYVRTDVAINQRIDGIQMVIDAKGRFSYVDFHTHEIQTIPVSNANSKSNRVTVPAQPSNYLDYFKSKNLLLGRLEDDFYLRGPIGNPTGKYFVDDKYYDDWQLSAVIIEASAQRILSIQLHLNHTIFEKSVRTKIQGNQKRDASKTKTLVIPVGQHLSLARFYLNTHGVLTGLKLSIYNGNESDCFGLCPEYNDPKKDAKSSKTIYFSNKDNIVGVFGYSDEKGIGSLGVLLNIKRGTEGLYFVTQDN